jgi:hypothetical protein
MVDFVNGTPFGFGINAPAILPVRRLFFTADGTTTEGIFSEVTLTGDCSIPFLFINSGDAGIRTIIGHSVGVLSQVYCEGASVKARLAGGIVHDFGAVPSNKLLSGVLSRSGTDWTLEIDGVAQGGTYTAAGNVALNRLVSNAGVAHWDSVLADIGIIASTDGINTLWRLDSGSTVSEASVRAGAEVLTFSNVVAGDWEQFTLVGADWLGSELVVNGGFDADTDWTKGTGWTIAGGTATKVGGGGTELKQSGILAAATSYRVSHTMISTTGAMNLVMGGTFHPAGVTIGVNTAVRLSGAGADLGFQGGADYDLDDVSCKRILESN